ncbi:DUF3944 domain-containing protein [Shewanella sp.]|uniref:DUF3944 domain-containing protein n=1 Tax=Shewanella sp. TaxID=50422 RepID=UPI003F2B3C85
MDINIASRYYKYREDDDLAFIAHCTHEQLAPLVNYLTIDSDGKPRLAETLTNNPEFKANRHDFSRAWQAICTELQTYGNSTALNIVTRKGAAYKDIVQLTAKSVGCSFEKHSDVPTIEQAIVAKVMKLQMDKMTQAERQAFIKTMKNDYQVNNFDPLKWTGRDFSVISGVLAGAFGGAAGAMLLPRALLFTSPFGIIGGLFSAVVEGPALRVTLPCVVHITMLREFHRHGNPFN